MSNNTVVNKIEDLIYSFRSGEIDSYTVVNKIEEQIKLIE